MEAANDERITKYRDWIAELERRKAGLAVDKKRMVWLLVAAAVTTPIAAYWGAVIAVFNLIFWLFLFGTSIYLSRMHGWEYDKQLEQAEGELEDLLEQDRGA